MKTREEILQKIEHLKNDNILNENRRQHFTELKEFDKVQIYKMMARSNEDKLDMLYWVINQE